MELDRGGVHLRKPILRDAASAFFWDSLPVVETTVTLARLF
jgi:hypothetical protein